MYNSHEEYEYRPKYIESCFAPYAPFLGRARAKESIDDTPLECFYVTMSKLLPKRPPC
jgi:hypothetical protein